MPHSKLSLLDVQKNNQHILSLSGTGARGRHMVGGLRTRVRGLQGSLGFLPRALLAGRLRCGVALPRFYTTQPPFYPAALTPLGGMSGEKRRVDLHFLVEEADTSSSVLDFLSVQSTRISSANFWSCTLLTGF